MQKCYTKWLRMESSTVLSKFFVSWQFAKVSSVWFGTSLALPLLLFHCFTHERVSICYFQTPPLICCVTSPNQKDIFPTLSKLRHCHLPWNSFEHNRLHDYEILLSTSLTNMSIHMVCIWVHFYAYMVDT